jgi:hypothetical protein
MSTSKNLKQSIFSQSIFLKSAECALQQNGWSHHWAMGIQARCYDFLFVTNMSKLGKSEPTYPYSILMQKSQDMREKNTEPEI